MFLGQAAILFNTSDISITNIFVAAVILAETRRLQQESFKKKEGLSDKCGITKR